MAPRKRRKYPSIVFGGYGSRLLAFIVDFILILVFALIFFIGNDAIFSHSTFGKEANTKLNNVKEVSALYLKVGDDLYLFNNDITLNNNANIYFSRLEIFYTSSYRETNYPDTGFEYQNSSYYQEDVAFNYFNTVLKQGDESSLFTFNEVDGYTTYAFKDTLSNKEKNDAWNSLYGIAIENLKTSTKYIEAQSKINQFVMFNLTISAFTGTIIPSLLIPLFLGHGRSLGKFMTGLAVVDIEGFQIKKWQVIVRFLVFGIFEIALNFYLLFIPLLLTSAAVTITRKLQALHDLASKTYVVDAKKSRIFKNAEDEEKYYTTPNDLKQELDYLYFTEAPLPKTLPLK